MNRSIQWMTAVLILAAGFACSSKKVMVPPSIDLADHEVLGIIDFRSSSKGDLANFTTRKFLEAARRDQGMVRVVRLGSEREILAAIGKPQLNQEAFKTLGESRELKTILVGDLDISDIKPSFSLSQIFESATISADVSATLSVEMIETSSGASMWNTSVTRTENVGHVSVFGGKDFVFDADDPEKAYGRLVNSLVNAATRDFQVRWVSQ